MFCDKFKTALHNAGLTHNDLAQGCEIPLGTVHSWAQGIREPAPWLQDVIISYLVPKAKKKKEKKENGK